MRRASVCLWVGLVIVSAAGWPGAPVLAQWNKNGEPMPDEPWRRSLGTFGAMLLLTTSDEEFFKQWDQPARPGYAPNLKPAPRAVRGEKVSALVFFVGCSPDGAGKCALEADFKVVRPDGTIHGDPPPNPLWQATAPPPRAVQVSRNRLALRFDEADPLGTYQVLVQVRDEVGGVEIELVQTIVLEDARTP